MEIVLELILIIIPLYSWLIITIKSSKYKKNKLKKDLSGFEVSRMILDSYELNNIYITETKESIISNYDCKRKVIRLKKDIFNISSITSCAVSAKEAAYAIQEKKKNKLFLLRSNIENFIKVLLYSGYLVLAIGILFGDTKTIYIGMAVEYVVLMFHLLTIKIEKNTTQIAISEITREKIATKKEIKQINELLKAYELIYVASIIYPIIEIIKKIIEFGNSKE